MNTQVVLLRAEDLVFWFYDSAWNFDEKERVASNLFKQGNFDVSILNSRLTYRDFEYLNPVFVEVAQTKEKKIRFTNIVACYVRQGGKIDPRLETVLNGRIYYWPAAVHQKMMEWKVDAEVEDARLGGRHLREMVSDGTQLEDVKGCERAIKQWIQWRQPGIERPKTCEWLCEAFRYTRTERNKELGILGALTDLGMFFKEQSVKEETLEAFREIRRSKKGDEDAIIDEVKRCGNEKAASLLVLMFYFMLKDACIRDSAFNIELCKQIAQPWFHKGFSKEMGAAVWLVGVNVHASNFAKEYNLWCQQMKGSVASEEAFFPEDINTFDMVAENKTMDAPLVDEVNVAKPEENVNLNTVEGVQDDKTSDKTTESVLVQQVDNVKQEEGALELPQEDNSSVTNIEEAPAETLVKTEVSACEVPPLCEKTEESQAESAPKNVEPDGQVGDVAPDERTVAPDQMSEELDSGTCLAGDTSDTLSEKADVAHDASTLCNRAESGASATKHTKKATKSCSTNGNKKSVTGNAKKKRKKMGGDIVKKADDSYLLGFDKEVGR